MSEQKSTPNYNVQVNQFYTHPWIVSLLTVGLIAAWIILFAAKPILLIIAIVITLLVAWFYLSFSSILKKYTNTQKRITDRTVLLDYIEFIGNETLLDVGCGNGILVLEAAKKLTSGKATGIDIWVETAGGHKAEVFQKNAELAGVADRVSLQNEDVRKLPYKDESFHIIISGLTMHHLSPGAGTLNSLSEIVRVLKPGGQIAIYDIPFFVSLWSRLLRKKGFEVIRKNREILYARKAISQKA